jgi:hypothetical protein
MFYGPECDLSCECFMQAWEECVLCCIDYIKLIDMPFRSTMSLLIFCLFDITVTDRGNRAEVSNYNH